LVAFLVVQGLASHYLHLTDYPSLGLATLTALVILLAGLFGWITKRQRIGLIKKAASLDNLRNLDWRAFEQLIAQAYRGQGFSVTDTADGADGGVDLVMKKNGETTYVQAKHWKSYQVDVKVVRELYGCMSGEAQRGVVVATNGFTREAVEWAKGRSLELIDGDGLLKLLGVGAGSDVAADLGPICPLCAAAMVRRTRRSDSTPFWGCSKYPRCKGTVAI
jgi:restriction system protein